MNSATIQKLAMTLWGKQFSDGEAANLETRTGRFSDLAVSNAFRSIHESQEIRALPPIKRLIESLMGLNVEIQGAGCGRCDGDRGKSMRFYPLRVAQAKKLGIYGSELYFQGSHSDGFTIPSWAQANSIPVFDLWIWCPTCSGERPNLDDIREGGKLYAFCEGPRKTQSQIRKEASIV